MEQFFFLKNQLVILEIKKIWYLKLIKDKPKNLNRWSKQKNRYTSKKRVGKLYSNPEKVIQAVSGKYRWGRWMRRSNMYLMGVSKGEDRGKKKLEWANGQNISRLFWQKGRPLLTLSFSQIYSYPRTYIWKKYHWGNKRSHKPSYWNRTWVDFLFFEQNICMWMYHDEPDEH